LNSLSGVGQQSGGIPVLPPLEFERPPSPGAVELERAIQVARIDSLRLEERRNTIIEKVEKLEKKKAKKQQQQGSKKEGSSSPPQSVQPTASSRIMADAAESLEVEEQETPKAPREPPIVFKGI